MFNKIKDISLVVLLLTTIIFGYLLFKKKDINVIPIPITFEVTTPEISNTFPPLEMPTPKREKPRPVAELPPEQERDGVLTDLLTERDYEEVFKDSVAEVTVRSTVQGHLLSQEIDYTIFKRTTKVDTVLQMEVPAPKPYLSGFLTLGAPLLTDRPDSDVMIEGGLILNTHRKISPMISANSLGYVSGGVSIKF